MTTYEIPRETDGTVAHFAWPGAYRIWYITADSAELCAECVQDNIDQCADQTDGGSEYDQWRVVGHYHEGDADSAGPCDNCGRTSDLEPLDD